VSQQPARAERLLSIPDRLALVVRYALLQPRVALLVLLLMLMLAAAAWAPVYIVEARG
jgi:hypothetical protein